MIDYAKNLCIHDIMSFRFYHEHILLNRAPHFRKDKMWLTSNLKNTNTVENEIQKSIDFSKLI